MLGADKAVLTESEWTAHQGELAPFVAWQAARPSTALAALGDARVRELHAGTFRQDLSALVVHGTRHKRTRAGQNRPGGKDGILFRPRLGPGWCATLVNFLRVLWPAPRPFFQVGTL